MAPFLYFSILALAIFSQYSLSSMNTHIHNINITSWLRDLGVLTLLFVCLFSFMLGSRTLAVPDEARYAEIPREMVASGNYIIPRLNGVVYFEKPVLFYWMQSAAIKMFGYNEWSLRFFTAFMGLLGCLITYVAGRKLYDRRTGFLASIILATSILYFAMAHVITLDMTVSVLLSGALFAFLIAIRSPARGEQRCYLFAMYVLAALAMLTKGLIGILFPGMIIGAWIILTWQWRLLKSVHLLSGALLFLAIVLPWHLLAQKAYANFFDFYFIHQHFLRYFTLAEHRYQPIWWFIPVTIVGFFPWITFLPQAIYQSLPRGFKNLHNPLSLAAGNCFLLVWIVIIFVFYSLSDSKLAPYILPIFPPMALLVAHYFANNWDDLSRRGIVIGFIFSAIIAGAAIIGLAFAPSFIETLNVNKLHYSIAAIIVILVLTTFMPLWLIRYSNAKFKTALSMLAASTVLIGWVANYGYEAFDDRSIYPLIQVLKPLTTKDSIVVSYAHYYQDLPAYLKQRVTVAKQNHQEHELGFGMTLEDTSAWMINIDTFWQRWQGTEPMFMLTSKKVYNKMLQQHRPSLFLLAETNNDVLLTNRIAK